MLAELPKLSVPRPAIVIFIVERMHVAISGYLAVSALFQEALDSVDHESVRTQRGGHTKRMRETRAELSLP